METISTATSGTVAEERVVLCSPEGAATGTAPKADVHHHDTPLHLAFSCYVFTPDGQVLVTRRARTKSTFPGIRTNSCCGHPGPGEQMTAAVRRRLRQELGVNAEEVDLILPTFRYRAAADDGTVENELCPVYRVTTRDPRLVVDVNEVDGAWWMPWEQFVRETQPGDPLSPWATRQLQELSRLGQDPLAWPSARSELLPPAAIP